MQAIGGTVGLFLRSNQRWLADVIDADSLFSIPLSSKKGAQFAYVDLRELRKLMKKWRTSPNWLPGKIEVDPTAYSMATDFIMQADMDIEYMSVACKMSESDFATMIQDYMTYSQDPNKLRAMLATIPLSIISLSEDLVEILEQECDVVVQKVATASILVQHGASRTRAIKWLDLPTFTGSHLASLNCPPGRPSQSRVLSPEYYNRVKAALENCSPEKISEPAVLLSEVILYLQDRYSNLNGEHSGHLDVRTITKACMMLIDVCRGTSAGRIAKAIVALSA